MLIFSISIYCLLNHYKLNKTSTSVGDDKNITENSETPIKKEKTDRKIEESSVSTLKENKNDSIKEVHINKDLIEKEVIETLNEYINAINKKDSLIAMNSLDPYRKDYENRRMLFDNIFGEFNVECKIDNIIEINHLDEGKVEVIMNMSVTGVPSKADSSSKEEKILMNYVFDKWRISSDEFLY